MLWVYTAQIFVLSFSLVPNEPPPYPLKGGNLLISSLVLGIGEIIYTQWGLDRVGTQWQPLPLNLSKASMYYSKHDIEIVLNLSQKKDFVYWETIHKITWWFINNKECWSPYSCRFTNTIWQFVKYTTATRVAFLFST